MTTPDPAQPGPTPAGASVTLSPQTGQPTTATVTLPAEPKPDTTDWKAEARKHEARAKENAEKAKQYDAQTEAAKTEAEKQADALRTAQSERDDASGRLARYEVAAATGLDASLVEFLPTGSREQMTAAAVKLLAATVRPPTRPLPDPSQGAGDPPESTEFDGLFSRPVPPT